jgi:YegS/Rv2252/BmrU family lipid kinase
MARSENLLRQIARKPGEHDRTGKAELEALIRSRGELALVVNTRARRGERLYSEASDLLAKRGLRVSAAYPVRDPVRLPEIVAEAVRKGEPFIVVGGGDGTISSVVDFFADRDVALGILPLGTANSFARSLGIPLDLRGAVDVLAAGKIADVDLGRIDDDLFANAASLGIAPAIARTRPHRLKRYLGRAGYLVAAAGTIAGYRPFTCRLLKDDGSVKTIENVVDILIANGTYHGGLLVAEQANVESRDLVIRVIKGNSRYALISAWARIWAGRSLPAEHLEIIRTTALTIETDHTEYVSIDGEVVAQTPIRVSIARQALRVMVPTDFKDR